MDAFTKTEHAAILANSEKIAPLGYLQIAEGRRPDLDIIVLPDEASYRANADDPQTDEMSKSYQPLMAAPPEWHDGEIVTMMRAEDRAKA